MNLLHRSTSTNDLRLNQRQRIITTGSMYIIISRASVVTMGFLPHSVDRHRENNIIFSIIIFKCPANHLLRSDGASITVRNNNNSPSIVRATHVETCMTNDRGLWVHVLKTVWNRTVWNVYFKKPFTVY